MVATLEMPVAKDKPKAGARKPEPVFEVEADEANGEDIAPILVAREISEWVTDISVYATRKAKKDKKLQGRKRVSNAAIVDDYLREAVWELRERCLNPGRAPGPTPERTIPPVPVELP